MASIEKMRMYVCPVCGRAFYLWEDEAHKMYDNPLAFRKSPWCPYDKQPTTEKHIVVEIIGARVVND